MVLLRSYSFLAFIISVSILGYAQVQFSQVERNDYATFTNYYRSDGICSYVFTNIIQDGFGLMWFATHDGLMRFDGHTFKTYRGGNSPKNVPHSNISSLALDKNNALWIGTKAGLCLYHPKSDSFERADSIFGKPLQGHRWVKDI